MEARPVPPAALALIRRFEGLHERCGPDRLRSYRCAAGVWTIGRGSTQWQGQPVTAATRCSLAEAEAQFQRDVQTAAGTVTDAVRVSLPEPVFAALVSLAHNIGSTAFRHSSLVRRLNAQELPAAVLAVELPRWVKGANDQVLEGLVRRRQAELALLTAGGGAVPPLPSAMIRFSDAAKYHQGLARQNDAWRYLFEAAPAAAWDALQEQLPEAVIHEFARRFRSGESAPAASVPAASPAPAAHRTLTVPYYSQRDNYRQADRTCFSSTCAMALKAVKPGAIQGDDDYLRTVFSLGDTTEAAVQIQALARYGVQARFRQDGTFALVRAQIDQGIPVPFGWLHRGPVSKPQGGGHWALAIGYTPSGLVVHDPWGEPDLVSGATLSSQGKGLHYSYKNLGPRWMVHGNDGWCLILR